jgi:hypothetical protein
MQYIKPVVLKSLLYKFHAEFVLDTNIKSNKNKQVNIVHSLLLMNNINLAY